MKYNEKWVWGTTRFYPHEMTEMMRNAIILLAVLTFLVVFWPGLFIPREEPADPTNTPEHIKPEWYFMGAYQALKEFKTITISENFEISGEVQGIAFQVGVLLMMFLVPFWEKGKRKPNEPVRPNKIALGIAVILILFLILGIFSNLGQGTGVQGILLHIIAIFGISTMPFWFGWSGHSIYRKKPLFWGTIIAIIGFIYVTAKGILI